MHTLVSYVYSVHWSHSKNPFLGLVFCLLSLLAWFDITIIVMIVVIW